VIIKASGVIFVNGSTHRDISSKFFAYDVGVRDAPASPAARERPRAPLSYDLSLNGAASTEYARSGSVWVFAVKMREALECTKVLSYESTFVLSYFRKKEMENIFFVFIALYMMRSVTFRKGDTRTA
jgi:hypothetical protein